MRIGPGVRLACFSLRRSAGTKVDWREIALKRRYGDKPVIYPPIPEHLLRED